MKCKHDTIASLKREIARLKEEKEYFISQNRLNSLEAIRLKKEKEEIYADIIHEGISGFKSQLRERIEDLFIHGMIDKDKVLELLEEKS